jgi:hypothetical protein
MNKLFLYFLLAVSVLPRTSFADNEVLSTFKDSSVQCNYLIVTIQDFEKPAIALAQHRNSYKFDNVEHAKVVFLSQIMAEFPGYDYTHRNSALWRAFKWARENWKIPFTYLVLMGNDEVGVIDSVNVTTGTVDSTNVSTGAIPAWYSGLGTTIYNFQAKNYPDIATDDCYINLSTLTPPVSYLDLTSGDPNLSIGRIPAANAAQCSIYVEKVKLYDISRPKGAWRNSVLAIADDAMQGTLMDPYGGDHQASTEQVVRGFLQGYSVTKEYLSAYPLDQFTEKPIVKNAIIKTMNSGVSWAFFFGHGNEQVLTDEHILTSESMDRIANDSMPVVFISLTTRNGFFFSSTPSSMCLKYLFSPRGGAIAYIASACPTYGSNNQNLGASFFSEVKKDPSGCLGAFLARAKSKVNDPNCLTYFLLGDPALRVSTGVLPVAVKSVQDSNPSHIQLSLPGISTEVNYSVTFTIRDSVFAAPISQNVPDLSFSCDSAIGTVSGVFRDSATIALPKGMIVPIKAIVYVWNDAAEGRAELMCNDGSTNPVLWKSVRTAVVGKPTIRKIRGGLAIAGLTAGINQIGIFDMLGRNIYKGEIQAGTGTVSIALAGKKLRAGRYFLKIIGRASETVLPFVYMAGE